MELVIDMINLMSNRKPHWGRKVEVNEFVSWVENEGSHPRAALVVGSMGMGKSALLEMFRERCESNSPTKWNVSYVRLYSGTSADAICDQLLENLYRVMRGRLIRKGPNDKNLLWDLATFVPTAIGAVAGLRTVTAALIRTLVATLKTLLNSKQRSGHEKFIEFLTIIAKHLDLRNEKMVFLIDPTPDMNKTNVGPWLLIADKLPSCMRLVIANRPDDAIAMDPQNQRHFRRLGGAEFLSELSVDDITTWYDDEFRIGPLSGRAANWSLDLRKSIVESAILRYKGHPLAHAAITRLLLSAQFDNPLEAINEWPQDVRDLMDTLFRMLQLQGITRLESALLIALFGLPVPRDTWATSIGISEAELDAFLANPSFSHFFKVVERNDHTLFHELFRERLDHYLLSTSPSYTPDLAKRALKALDPLLTPERLETETPGNFELIAACNLAHRTKNIEVLIEYSARTHDAKSRLHLLEEIERDQLRILMTDVNGQYQGHCFRNLASLALQTGEYGKASGLIRRAEGVFVRFNNRMALAQCLITRGLISRARGDLKAAKSYLLRSRRMVLRMGPLITANVEILSNLALFSFEEQHLLRAAVLNRCVRLARLARGVSKKNHDMLRNYALYADILVRLLRFSEAETAFVQVLADADAIGAIGLIADTHGNLGSMYTFLAGLQKVESAEERGNLSEQEHTFAKQIVGQLPKNVDFSLLAENHLRKSLRIHDDDMHDTDGAAIQHVNLGRLYQSVINNTAKAREHFQLARDAYAELGNRANVLQIEQLLGSLEKLGSQLEKQ